MHNLIRWAACIVHKRPENSCNKGGKRMSETIVIKKDSYYRDVLKKFTAHKLAMIALQLLHWKYSWWYFFPSS